MIEENVISISEEFPEKPFYEEKGNNILRSIGSIVLFIAAFYLFFDMSTSTILVLVLVLLIHEAGHYTMMKYYNYSDVKMFFIPFFGALVTGSKHEISQKENAIVLLAGPVPGILIGSILLYIGIPLEASSMIFTAKIFLFLNVFNLIPLTPLDGGQLIETLFFKSKNLLRLVFTILSAIGLVFLAFYLETYFLILLPFAMLNNLRQQAQVKKIKAVLDENSINYNKPYDEISNSEYWLIREQIIRHISGLNRINPMHYEESNHEKTIIAIMKSLHAKEHISDLSPGLKFTFSLIWIIFASVPLLLFYYFF